MDALNVFHCNPIEMSSSWVIFSRGLSSCVTLTIQQLTGKRKKDREESQRNPIPLLSTVSTLNSGLNRSYPSIDIIFTQADPVWFPHGNPFLFLLFNCHSLSRFSFTPIPAHCRGYYAQKPSLLMYWAERGSLADGRPTEPATAEAEAVCEHVCLDRNKFVISCFDIVPHTHRKVLYDQPLPMPTDQSLVRCLMILLMVGGIFNSSQHRISAKLAINALTRRKMVNADGFTRQDRKITWINNKSVS